MQSKSTLTFRGLDHASLVGRYAELLLAEENGSVTPRRHGQQRAEAVVPGELAVALVAAVVKHEPQTRRRFAAKVVDGGKIEEHQHSQRNKNQKKILSLSFSLTALE